MCDRSFRIFHLITGIDVGGAENHLLDLSRELTKQGHEITIGYLKGGGKLQDEFKQAGCRVEQFPISRNGDPRGFLRLLWHLHSRSYDVFHGHLFMSNVYGVPAATAAGIKNIVVTKHNDEPFWQRQPIRTAHQLLLDRTDGIITISDHIRTYLTETANLDDRKVETIHYGLDPAPFEAIPASRVSSRRSELVGGSEYLVGTVGRLTKQKNLSVLLEAFSEVLAEVPDTRLVIVGEGEQESSLRKLATELGIIDNVTFTGFQDDIPVLMNAFDVFALPSKWEGFGMVFLEAMASGTPIAGSTASAIPEVVGESEAGLLTDPEDSAALAKSITEIITDEQLAARLGQNGRTRVRERFSPERMAEDHIEYYEWLD